jgi:predicted 2-oxoglutarate/Fe(II)-dependent dioxygenase YbiX
MTETKHMLARGQRAPDFVLPGVDGTPTRFYAKAGGAPTVLLHSGPASLAAVRELAEGLGERVPDQLSVHLVWRGELAFDDGPPFPAFLDTEGKIASGYGADDAPTAFVLDPNLRILDAFELDDGRAAARRILEAIDSLPGAVAVEITAQAPVLLVPNALDDAMCAELIDAWETRGNVETGVEQTAGGRREDALQAQFKRRRDHTITDADLNQRIGTSLGRRIMPEIRKAFCFRATGFEGFKIGCYDASTGGFFKAHRDNLSPTTAHRSFALTLNLNEDYQGGQLRFPEYGPQLYRPDAGAALIFSCSHLHEVMNVTAGRRFVLLSFLLGERDAHGGASPAGGSAGPQATT